MKRSKAIINIHTIGYITVIISLIIFFFGISLTSRFMSMNDTACSSVCGKDFPFCPYNHQVPLESVFLLFTSLVLVALGVYLIVYPDKKDREETKASERKEEIPKKEEPNYKREELLETLSEDERRVLDIILESNGIYQSQLIEKTGFSRVRITRILDKLEAKDIVERKRRGMTNFVTLKK